jgi:electron transfer flavoprotein alpha subunit
VDTEQEDIGPLKIIVCIKQVPLLSALRFDPQTHRLVREGVPLEVNELDVYAITEAVRLRTLHGGEVIVITMGPPQAHEALATALAIGADRAIHLSDRAFGGADTAATAFTLSLAIAPEHPDLIFCGRHSIDAETSQVGPELAEIMAIPQISAIQKIDLRKRNGKTEVIATRETDEGSETLSVPIPALVTAAESLNEGMWPDEHAIRAASQHSERYQVVTAVDLNADSNLLGQKGSPTWVSDVEPDTHTREGRVLTDEDPLKLVELLANDLQARGLLDLEKIVRSRTHQHSAASQRLGEPLPGRAVWVIAETSPKGIRRVTLELLGKGIELAAKLQGELAAVLIGGADISDHVATLAAYGAERVYVAADPALEHYTTGGYSAVLSEAILTYHPAVVLLGSTANGRDLAPRVAARLKLGLTGDCIDLAIDDQQRLVQYKPAFGNLVISLILSNALPAMTTLRPGMLHAAEADFSRIPVIEQIPTHNIASQIHAQIINHEYRDIGVEELESAQIILGVGMGMGEPGQYTQVYRLAALLNAAIGATRNVTDQGWLPKQTQIGLTGRAVAPQLYLALGIRGAAEHVAGIRKANYVVAINKNKRAAIFHHSDIGVIGDVHILLPLLIEHLEKRKNMHQISTN